MKSGPAASRCPDCFHPDGVGDCTCHCHSWFGDRGDRGREESIRVRQKRDLTPKDQQMLTRQRLKLRRRAEELVAQEQRRGLLDSIDDPAGDPPAPPALDP